MITLDSKVVYDLLTDDGTKATVLHVIALTKYGPEIYEIDPLDLLLRLQEDFGCEVTDANENKLKAILLATSTDLFYQDPEAFRAICETLVNGDPAVELLDSLTAEEIAIGLFEVEQNRPPATWMAPQIERLIDAAIGRDGNEETPDDPSSHVRAYVTEWQADLTRQLARLGVPLADLPRLDPNQPVGV